MHEQYCTIYYALCWPIVKYIFVENKKAGKIMKWFKQKALYNFFKLLAISSISIQ